MKIYQHNRSLDSLTGARFIAAIVVVLFHLQYENWAAGNQYSSIGLSWLNRGYLGVDFFFILSGFILPYAHSELSIANQSRTTNNYNRFIIKRFARIYPAYIFVLLLWIVLEGSKYFNPVQSSPVQSSLTAYELWHVSPAFSGSWSTANLISTAFMLQATGIDVGSGWNGPGWSVSAEIFTYFLLPFIWAKLRNSKTTALFILLALCQTSIYIYASMHGGSLHVFKGPILLRCLIEGTMGSILYYIFRRNALNSILSSSITTIAAATTIVLLTRFRHRLPLQDTAFLPLFSLIIISLANIDSTGRKTILHRLKYLGEISFSIYLCHYLMILLAQRIIAIPDITSSATREISVCTLAISSSILCAALIHKYIEIPSRNFIIQKFPSRIHQ